MTRTARREDRPVGFGQPGTCDATDCPGGAWPHRVEIEDAAVPVDGDAGPRSTRISRRAGRGRGQRRERPGRRTRGRWTCRQRWEGPLWRDSLPSDLKHVGWQGDRLQLPIADPDLEEPERRSGQRIALQEVEDGPVGAPGP